MAAKPLSGALVLTSLGAGRSGQIAGCFLTLAQLARFGPGADRSHYPPAEADRVYARPRAAMSALAWGAAGTQADQTRGSWRVRGSEALAGGGAAPRGPRVRGAC